MKIKLSKKYSLILIFVMAFSFFAPTIVSANETIGLRFPNYVVVEKQTGKSVCDVGEANVGLKPKVKNYIYDAFKALEDARDAAARDEYVSDAAAMDEDIAVYVRTKFKYDLKASKDARDAAAANEDVSDAETMTDEDDNEYNNNAKNLDNNKKTSNENINKLDINKNFDDKKNFSEEDIYGGDSVIKFGSNLGDDTDIYDQQAGEKGHDVDKQIADPERDGYTLDGMKPPKDLISSTENNDINNLFQKNTNVSSYLNNHPVETINSIARFRRLGKSKPKNASNISGLSSENVGIFSNFKEKIDIFIKHIMCWKIFVYVLKIYATEGILI